MSTRVITNTGANAEKDSAKLSRIFESSKVGKHAALGFGLAFIALMWASVWYVVDSQKETIEHESRQEITNLALVVEQNVVRTASELDRILKFLRQSHERNGFQTDWPTLVREDFAIDDQTVQIAIMDRKGIMLTSSALLYPKSVVDLSDREHFLVHANSKGLDRLFISKPVLGRASGKWSVQFTRPYKDMDGEFGGVIVISLDPAHLSRIYSELKLGSSYGIAVIGEDGVVRAGSGLYAQKVGQEISDAELKAAVSGLTATDADGARTISSLREATGYPLRVLVTADRSPKDAIVRHNRDTYVFGASLLTVLALAGIVMAARARDRYDSRIVRLARHDALTGLPNRLAFSEAMEMACEATPAAKRFALHLIDLDGFKGINDSYGHPTGDKLLEAVAIRLRENLRQCDVLARLGGDEFAILQPVNQAKEAEPFAERVCKLLAKPFQIGPLTVTIGGSIGIACCPTDGVLPADLLRLADLALYEAKATGRGTYSFYEASMNQKAQAKRALQEGLACALDRGELDVYYQPIVDIRTEKVLAFEALLRWRHPVRGFISPVEFIPIAEETGMIVAIGEWVLQRACMDVMMCPGRPSISVNCSPLQFKCPDFVERVKNALASAGLEADRLKLEITESALMQNDALTMQLLTSLRDLGVQLSMDDFGTGYSSLSYLERYPLNYIKIDRSFVTPLSSAQSSSAVVRAIVAMAASLNMRTIAEGVETPEQLEVLRALGCNEAQGFYFGKPMPAGTAFLACLSTESKSLSLSKCA